jgi:hypothetical protein
MPGAATTIFLSSAVPGADQASAAADAAASAIRLDIMCSLL